MRARALIDLNALRHNAQVVRQLMPHSEVLAVVKADAYHHGAERVCRALTDVDYFGVATIAEAQALSMLDLAQPVVLMLGFFDREDLQYIYQHNFQVFVHQRHQIELLRQYPPAKPLHVWLKINTGMNRFGFEPAQVAQSYADLCSIPNIVMHAQVSHFACADETKHVMNRQQLACFDRVRIAKLAASWCNSAAIINQLVPQDGIVRPGMMLYGVNPGVAGCNIALKPVMTLQGRVMACHHLTPGMSVGYGGTWQAQQSTEVAIITLGYADAYPQYAQGASVLLQGRLAPVLGRTSMDSMIIDISAFDRVNVGEWVTLWGDGLPLEQVAQQAGRSVYDLLTSVSERVYQQHIDAW
jgi:alanine racemase